MHLRIVWCVLLTLSVAAVCFADSPNAESERLAALEQRIEQQTARIQQLETQLASSANAPFEAQRVAALKQQIREVLSEREFRESLMPATLSAGYDKGFYIVSSDERFKLVTNGRIQFRWTHYNTRTENRYLNRGDRRGDRTGFDVQRLRFGFSGHVYDKDLTYRLEVTGDGGDNIRLRYAWINYRLADEFQMLAGVFKIASTRAQMTSSSRLQLVDRSLADAVFQFDRGLGVRFWGRLFDKRLEYFLDVVNSLNSTSNRTITTDPAEMDNNPAIVFHTVWHALGDTPGADFKSPSDIEHHESPALDLGFHYAFNEDDGDSRTTEIPFRFPRRPRGVGGFGLTTTNGLQLHQFGLEAAFKYMGFSATAEYFLRVLDVRGAYGAPYAHLFQVTGEDSTVAQHGAYLDLGYFLPIPGLERKLELVGRVGGISVNTEGSEGTWEYGGGLNYYIHGHNVKLQADVVKISEVPITSNSHSLANVNDDALIFRVQLQTSF